MRFVCDYGHLCPSSGYRGGRPPAGTVTHRDQGSLRLEYRGQALRVRVTHYGHCSVLEVGGHLDFITAPTLTGHVEAAWDRSAGPRLVLEVSQLTFYDSTALGIMAHTRQRVRDTVTGRLLFAGVPHGLRQLLQRTGLLAHFELRDSVEQAVAELLPMA